MGDHFFLLMYATSGEERNVTRFTSYRRVEDAVAMVKEWLEKACCMDCYPAAEEAALREANGGQLPETAFLCPEEAIRTFLVQGGFPLFDPEEEGASDIFVIPEGGFAPNEDPTV